MVIVEKFNLVFVHIPKTAGTSIKKWMQKHFDARLEGSPHAGVRQIEEKKINLPKHPIFFAVVRNPFARQLSHYTYHLHMHRLIVKFNAERKIKDPGPIHILERLEKGFEHWFLSKDEFVRPEPRWWDYRWTNQHEWIDENTHVMKYEQLEKDIQWLYEITGCHEPLPFENVSKSHEYNYRHFYSDILRKEVEKKHKADLDKFGYKF